MNKVLWGAVLLWSSSALAQQSDQGVQDPVAKKILAELSGMTGFLLDYAIALAAVGALTMALIEGAKTILRVRDRFHEQALRNFLGAGQVSRNNGEEAFSELMRLATGASPEVASLLRAAKQPLGGRTPDNALFTVELERMMSLVQDAADTALNYPSMYPQLYSFLVAGASPEDVGLWRTRAESASASDSDEQRQQDVAVYGRLTKFAKRRLDGFQMATGFRWKELNQFGSYQLGFVILLLALWPIKQSAFPWLVMPDSFPWLVIFASLIGGVVAPVAKDLVVALQRVRSGG